MRQVLRILPLATFAILVGCSDSSSDDSMNPTDGGSNSPPADAGPHTPSPLAGRTLYEQPHSDGNNFACATCHALEEPTNDGFLRPGHPIGNAAHRPNFKNGQLDNLLDAVNVCRTEWMIATAWSMDTPEWLDLEAFLEQQAPEGDAPSLVSQVAAPPQQTGGGDMVAGQNFFNNACVVCHGEDAVGTERAPALIGEFLNADQIARRVRTSGLTDSSVYEGLTGGRMPFWANDRISDDELRDVIAFLLTNDPRTGSDGGNMSELRECDATHTKIGQVAVFTTRYHNVGGTATIIDDCTIQIDNFTYDGQGVDVRFYSGLGGNYAGGFSMSKEDLHRNSSYNGETVYAQLPEGRSLDELDGISVWCVDFAINFGDGTFQTP